MKYQIYSIMYTAICDISDILLALMDVKLYRIL